MIRLSILESSKMFGVSEKTIRRAIKNQEVIYIVVAGRYKITFESLVRWSQKKTRIRKKNEKHGIGQFVDKWKIKNTFYSPRPPKNEDEDENTN